MKYTEGYLAFLDVLGFSKFVENEENGQATSDLFDFVNKFCYLFNTTPNLHVQVSFFSDTIIITTDELHRLVLPIYIAESYLKDKLGLLFRGAIVYGKYYHKKGTTFGPAVVSGYQLEKKALYSRILIEDTIKVDEDDIFYFDDIDGYKCFNPYGMFFTEIIKSAPHGTEYPDEINKELIDNFTKRRNELLDQISKYKGTAVIDKYLWRVRAFNHICKFVANIPLEEVIYKDINYLMNEDLKNQMLKLSISENEYI